MRAVAFGVFALLFLILREPHGPPVETWKTLLFLCVLLGGSRVFRAAKGRSERVQLSPERQRLMWTFRVLSWVPIGWAALTSLVRTGGQSMMMGFSLRERLFIATSFIPMVAAEWIRSGGVTESPETRTR
jgi:hypothetical protein